jgi:hypothetical protein
VTWVPIYTFRAQIPLQNIPKNFSWLPGARGSIPARPGSVPRLVDQIKICRGSRTPSCETNVTLTTLALPRGVDS